VTDQPVATGGVVHFEAADGTRLGLHVIGSGPALVCVPGGPGRASEYLEDLAGLSAERTLLRLDLRGSGTSELPADRESLSFPRLADDLEALRLERHLESMDLIAHSAGCFVALVYASRHPDRVSRLILVTPSGKGLGDVDAVTADVERIKASRSDEPWYADAAALEAEMQHWPVNRRERPARELRMFGYGRWNERAQAHAAMTDRQVSLRAMAAFASDSFGDEAAEFLAALRALPAPVLVIVGDHDGMTGVLAGKVNADLMPNSRVVELAGAGHYPWIDTPERFRGAVVSFLNEAPPAAHP
jgi:pimeloyl-ACP methyl ester carboxylesterase